MNSTQTTTTAGAAVSFLAGLLAGRGAFGLDQATWLTILSSVAGVAVTIYTAVQTRKSGLVTEVANMTEVHTVKLNSNSPGSVSLSKATPHNVGI